MELKWDKCINVRDLGGLISDGGNAIKHGQFIRSDSPHMLDAQGWKQLQDYGIKTIIDLRSDNERVSTPHDLSGITVVSLPHDGIENTGFWGDLNSESWSEGWRLASTPLYYSRHLDSMPERSVRVLQAIAEAPPGGVLFHCIAGRDRTGMIAMLLLHVLEVTHDQIASDYCLSRTNRINNGSEQQKKLEKTIDEYLNEQRKTPMQIILDTLSDASLKGKLRNSGLTDDHVRKLKTRAYG